MSDAYKGHFHYLLVFEKNTKLCKHLTKLDKFHIVQGIHLRMMIYIINTIKQLVCKAPVHVI